MTTLVEPHPIEVSLAEAPYVRRYLNEAIRILASMMTAPIDAMAESLAEVRNGGGRVFVLGVGGSAATASHAVNDFRKLCGIEAYAPTDNVAELTARTNDEGWSSVFMNWLDVSRLDEGDALLVLSVGGGAKGVSECLNYALEYASSMLAKILGIVGRDGGNTALVADPCIVIPPLFAERVTPHTEGIASVILHCLVSHPLLARHATKW